MSPKKFFAKLFKKIRRGRERGPDAISMAVSRPLSPDPAVAVLPAQTAASSDALTVGNAGGVPVRVFDLDFASLSCQLQLINISGLFCS